MKPCGINQLKTASLKKSVLLFTVVEAQVHTAVKTWGRAVAAIRPHFQEEVSKTEEEEEGCR